MKRTTTALALVCLLCAGAHAQTAGERDEAQRAFVEGAKAVEGKHLEQALVYFGRAARLDPKNTTYTQALEIARQNRITELVQQSAKARLAGDEDGASAPLREAYALDQQSAQHNPMIEERLEELARDREHDEAPSLLNAKVDRSMSAPALAPRPGPPQSFHLYSSRDQLIRAVFGAWGLTPLIDKSVQAAPGEDARVHYDQDGVSFAEALRTLELATNTFCVPLDPEHALLALDTRANRMQFERYTEETVYLPGVTQQETTDLANVAKNLFDAQQASANVSAGALVVRMPASRVEPFNVLLTQLLAGKSEVMLNVDFYEIDRTRDVTLGATLPNSSTIFNVSTQVQQLINANPTLVQEIISQGLATPGNYLEIAEALIASGQAGTTVLTQPFAYFGGGITLTGLTFNGGTANASLSATKTDVLDSAQLRVEDGDEGTFKVGERYPIVTSSYSNLAVGSTAIAGVNAAGLSSTLASLGISTSALASATTPQVQYQDIGLTLRATPRVEGEHDVSLKLDLQITALSGQTLNSNPILNSRQYQTITSLKPGEQAVVVSELSDQESHALTGIPFLSEIPGMNLWTQDAVQDSSTDLVIVITPRIVRLAHRDATGPMLVMPQHS